MGAQDASILGLIAARAELACISLWAALLLGYFIGQFLPAYLLVERASLLAGYFGKKLNRRSRDVATRAWRGAVVLGFFVVPAAGFGLILSGLPLWAEGIVLACLFTAGLRSHRILALWQQARRKEISLLSQGRKHLFTDTHGVLRYEILHHAAHLAVGIMGAAFWFVLGGLTTLFSYLALAFASAEYATEHPENRAFGGVARGLFQLADTIPRLLTACLLLVAGFFVPGCKPAAALPSLATTPRDWTGFIARLLGVALGGPTKLAHGSHVADWVGEGSAKLTSADFTRWVLLWMVALLLLGLVGLFLLTF